MDREPRELKPYSVATSVATGSTVPTPPPSENAAEVIPIMIFAPSRTVDAVRDMRPRVITDIPPVAEVKQSDQIEDIKKIAQMSPIIKEADAPADADPKAVTSSATDSANGSEGDSSETLPPPTEPVNPTHPSSLSVEPVTPAPVVKESSPSVPLSGLPTNLGFLPPPAWELEPLPAAVTYSSPDEEKPAS